MNDLDRKHIQLRMQQLVQTYTDATKPMSKRLAGTGRDSAIWLARQRKMQDEFYTAMQYYENLLYAPPPPTTTESQTNIVPWTPPLTISRGRGRPSTGGRKPRDRRVNRDDDSY